MEDEQLVSEFLRTRSERAFSRLYKARTPRLYRMALRLTQDVNESEELIQQMWITAAEKLHGFEWRSSLSTWLTAILINLFRNTRKQAERHSTDSLELVKEDAGYTDNVTSADLENAIASLPPGYRQIIILHDIEGYTHKEIATIMDISEGTSKSQLFHARRAIRNYFSFDNSKRHQS